MTVTAVAMPRLGMTMEEGTVVAWPVPVGTRVEKGQTVVVIESEKNEAEIEATASGVLRHVYVEPGSVVPCGALLAVLTSTADEPFDSQTYARSHAEARSATTPRPALATAPAAAPTRRGASTRGTRRTPVTPAARALARRLDLAPERIPGSGPGGRVLRQDVEAFAAARERRVEVAPGVQLEVLREGAGEPVLFLPGFGSDLGSFAAQTRALAGSHQAVGVHPRGVGGSDAPDEPSYTVEQMAADVASLIDDPAHLVGASLGAAVALELALRHPGKVRSLALLTPFVRHTARLAAVTDAWVRLAAEATPETLARFLLPWFFSEDFLGNPGARERTARGLARSVTRCSAATLARQRRGLASWSGSREERLREIPGPTLVLAGGADLLTPDAERLAAELPRSHVVIVAGAGHALSIEAPDSVTRALREHLAGAA